MKPEVHCTSVASVVSIFVGSEKKTWPISHFHDSSRSTTVMAFHAYYAPPLEGSERNLTYY